MSNPTGEGPNPSDALFDLHDLPLDIAFADNAVLAAAARRLAEHAETDGEVIAAFSSGPGRDETEEDPDSEP